MASTNGENAGAVFLEVTDLLGKKIPELPTVRRHMDLPF